MARRKRTNTLIVVSFFLLVAAILAYAGIYTYAPEDGDAGYWVRLQQACLAVAAVAAALWLAGFTKRKRDNDTTPDDRS
ncbi:MAG: hypothetical protein LIO85_00275 [Rikenellaceae bacterium]|nr:hypothetical protein [Rikenellaceae bacterium]